jgi:chemotaxis protein histidine kinase CheA
LIRATPKARSAEFREAWSAVKAHFDVNTLGVLLLDALERASAEQIYGKLLGRSPGGTRPKSAKKDELIGPVVKAFFELEETAYLVMRAMDKTAEKERHIVHSIPEQHAKDRVGSYRAITLKRERAKFLWALVRDDRPTVRDLVGPIVTEFILAAGDHAASAQGDLKSEADARRLAARLREQESMLLEATERMTSLEAKVDVSEAERARMLAQIGAKERDLREATEAREELEAQLREMQEALRKVETEESQVVDARAREMQARQDAAQLAQKIRRLSKLASASQELSQAKAELAEKERALAGQIQAQKRLESSMEKLQVEHFVELEELRQELAETREALRAARQQLAAGGEESRPSAARDGGVLLLVDQANLSSVTQQRGEKVDYHKLHALLVGGRPVLKMVAFVVDNGGSGFEAFCEILRNSGFELRIKRPKVFADGTKKADWDMAMAMEAVMHADRANTVILGTGDGDFAPLVRYLKRRGVHVEVASFPEALAQELSSVASRVVALDASVCE